MGKDDSHHAASKAGHCIPPPSNYDPAPAAPNRRATSAQPNYDTSWKEATGFHNASHDSLTIIIHDVEAEDNIEFFRLYAKSMVMGQSPWYASKAKEAPQGWSVKADGRGDGSTVWLKTANATKLEWLVQHLYCDGYFKVKVAKKTLKHTSNVLDLKADVPAWAWKDPDSWKASRISKASGQAHEP